MKIGYVYASLQYVGAYKFCSVKFVVRFCISTNVQFFRLHVLSVHVYCEDILYGLEILFTCSEGYNYLEKVHSDP